MKKIKQKILKKLIFFIFVRKQKYEQKMEILRQNNNKKMKEKF